MQRSLERETQTHFVFLMSVYEKILTPHQVIRMHRRAQPWWADAMAVIQVLGAHAKKMVGNSAF